MTIENQQSASVSVERGEPVAWMNPSWADPDTRGWPSDSFASIPIDGWMPLYTSPPYEATPLASQSRSDVKPWRGLTRPEIAKASADAQVDFCLDKQPTYEVALARAIEAKLREKNA